MKTIEAGVSIPKFGLYGEPNLNQDPGFVHIEDIAARSSDTGWLIKPHRHGKMFQILFIFDGNLDVQIDGSHHSLEGSWAITIPPGVVHGFRFQPEAKGLVLTLAEPLLMDQSYQKSLHLFDDFIAHSMTIKLQENDALLAQLIEYLGLIEREFKSTDTGHQLMLEWLVNMVLMTLKRQVDHSHFQAASGTTGSQMLSGFRALLELHYRKHWSVKDYALALHTSVSTLNRLCNETVNATAKAIIQDRLLIEAKRRLIYTEEALDQTAYTLGFNDPAYFSRFFKKLEGVSPSEYRKNNNYETTQD